MTKPNRRKADRFRVDREVNPIAGPYRLVNIGVGGFAIESKEPFQPAEERPFQFVLGAGVKVTVHATVAHAMRVNRGGEPPVYVTGFAYLRLADGSCVEEVVQTVIDYVSTAAGDVLHSYESPSDRFTGVPDDAA